MREKSVLTGLVFVGLLACLAIAMQFMRVVDNPPVTEEVLVLTNVKAILKKLCFDCHSN